MALSLCTNPVAFLGVVSSCAFVSSLTCWLPFQAQSLVSSAFVFPFGPNGHLSVCLFGPNGHLSACGVVRAVHSSGFKDNVLWPQSTCSSSSFLIAAVFHS